MVRIVMDSNVIISSFFWNGNERLVFERSMYGLYQNITSSHIADELQKVLTRKFLVPNVKVHQYLHHVLKGSILVFPSGSIDTIQNDPSDNYVLETAVLGNADVIVTGDHHLLELGSFRNIIILTSRG